MTPSPPEARPEELSEREVIERIAARGDLRVLGLPVDDVKDMYRLMAEWNRLGGRPALIDEFRERTELVARLAQAEANLRALDSQIVEAETRASTSEAALLQLRRDHAELGCPDCQLWLSSLAGVKQP